MQHPHSTEKPNRRQQHEEYSSKTKSTWQCSVQVHNIPFFVDVATYHKWAVQIKMKIILWVVIAIEKRAESFGISKLPQRTKGTCQPSAVALQLIGAAKGSRHTVYRAGVPDQFFCQDFHPSPVAFATELCSRLLWCNYQCVRYSYYLIVLEVLQLVV